MASPPLVSAWPPLYAPVQPFVPVFMREVLDTPAVLGQFRDYSPWELQVSCPVGLTPTRSTEKAAGYDLYSPVDETIPSKGSLVVDTCVCVALPSGHYAKIEGRSGLAFKYDVVAFGGVIDEDYRGTIAVKLFNWGESEYTIRTKERIAQMVIQPYASLNVRHVPTLDTTTRGVHGFGASGR